MDELAKVKGRGWEDIDVSDHLLFTFLYPAWDFCVPRWLLAQTPSYHGIN